MTIYSILNLLAIAIVGSTVVILPPLLLDPTGMFIFFMIFMFFACIPFFIGCSVKNTAKYRCGFPYSSFANGNLILHDDKLEFIHWRVGMQEPAAYSSKRAVYRDEDSFVYTIGVADISTLRIDKNHICHISGAGILSRPEWAGTKGVREEIKTKTFSFLLDFEDTSVEDAIRKWRKNNG